MEEDQVGDEMYMIIKGEVKLRSDCAPKFEGKAWVDGAFFGELPMLGLANGELRNKHVYTVEAVVESHLTYLRREDMEDMERDYPMFKAQVRQLASKRAERFGLEIKRVTITVSNNRRRMSVALDDNDSMADVDPDMQKAFAKAGGAPPMPEADKDHMAKLAAKKRESMAAQGELEEEDSEEDEIPLRPASGKATKDQAGASGMSAEDGAKIIAKLELLDRKINTLQASVAAYHAHE